MRTPELAYCWLHWDVIVKAHKDNLGLFLQGCPGQGMNSGVFIAEKAFIDSCSLRGERQQENRLLISSHHDYSGRRVAGQTQGTHTV